MKFRVYVNQKRPKISSEKIKKHITRLGHMCSDKDHDIAIVVGGDGTFGYYGKKLSMPILFVGVSEPDILGSRSRLAETSYEKISDALDKIESGNYLIERKHMFNVFLNGKLKGPILTDIYIERGTFSGCLRYKIKYKVTSNDFINVIHSKENLKDGFEEFAISNGIIIATSFGQGGYFSYPSRLKSWNSEMRNPFSLMDNQLGICHILPTFLVRLVNGRKLKSNNIRYSVPFFLLNKSHLKYSKLQISLIRDADARLYGITRSSKGIPFGIDDKLSIQPSTKLAKIIILNNKDKKEQRDRRFL